MTDLVVRDGARLPAAIEHPTEAETEMRLHEAILKAMRLGRAALDEQIRVQIRVVEYAIRVVDLVDEMRAAGELADHGGDRSTPEVRGMLTLADLKLNDRRLAEWRSLRDNDALGFLRNALDNEREDTLKRACGLNWLRLRIERIARETVADDRRARAIPVFGDFLFRDGDYREMIDHGVDGVVDAVITDPPYDRAFLESDAAAELGAHIARWLKPNGFAAVMVGGYFRREWEALLDVDLAYWWSGAYLVEGPRRRVYERGVGAGWKPILIYARQDHDELPFITDDVFVSPARDKDHHDWGQSADGIAELVERLTPAGGLVCDPFLGGGTTAVACRDLGRRFVGSDIDPAAIMTTLDRLGAS